MNEENDGQYHYEEENENDESDDEAIENVNMVSEWLIGSWNIKKDTCHLRWHLSDDKTMPDSNFHDLDRMTTFKLYMIALIHFECVVNK